MPDEPIMDTPQQALRRLADSLDKIEHEYGVVCTVIRGQAAWCKNGACDFENIDAELLWRRVNSDDCVIRLKNGKFPEISISARVDEVRIPLFYFTSESCADGRQIEDPKFRSEYPKIMKKLKNAPSFIKSRIEKLYNDYLEKNKKSETYEKETLLRDLRDLEFKTELIKKKLNLY